MRGHVSSAIIAAALVAAVACGTTMAARGARLRPTGRAALRCPTASTPPALRLAVLHRARVGDAPIALAVDPRARRALIVDRGPLDRRGFVAGHARLAVVDATTGRPLRTVALPQPAYLAPEFGPVADDAPLLVVDPVARHAFLAICSVDRSALQPWPDVLYMLDTATGAIRGTTPLQDCAAPLIDDPRAGYVAAVEGEAGVVLILDARTGRVVRSIVAKDINDQAILDPVAGRLAVLYTFGTVQPLLIDPRTGAVRRAAPLAGDASGFLPGDPEALAVDPRLGRLIIGTQDNGRIEHLYILDDCTGKALARIDGAGGTTLAADAATGRIVAVSTAFDPIDIGPAILSVIDTRSRRTVRSATIETVPGGAPTADAVDPARGRIFLATDGDTTGQQTDALHGALVLVIDARSGRTLAQTTLASNAAALALDAATGHILVADANGTLSVIAATSP